LVAGDGAYVAYKHTEHGWLPMPQYSFGIEHQDAAITDPDTTTEFANFEGALEHARMIANDLAGSLFAWGDVVVTSATGDEVGHVPVRQQRM
jgi:hypothetical protein